MEFYAQDRAAWRMWLKTNHKKQKNLWLILYNKDSGVACVTYAEAIEEALCWGWIDSKANKRDDKSRFQYFAERKPKGVWSKINKERVARMIQEGRMTQAGMIKIKEAKKNGSWNFLNPVDSLRMPTQLKKAFAGRKKALGNFEAFPPSVKKQIFHWIISAKRDETRNARIKETVTLAARNLRANQWIPMAKRTGH